MVILQVKKLFLSGHALGQSWEKWMIPRQSWVDLSPRRWKEYEPGKSPSAHTPKKDEVQVVIETTVNTFKLAILHKSELRITVWLCDSAKWLLLNVKQDLSIKNTKFWKKLIWLSWFSWITFCTLYAIEQGTCSDVTNSQDTWFCLLQFHYLINMNFCAFHMFEGNTVLFVSVTALLWVMAKSEFLSTHLE